MLGLKVTMYFSQGEKSINCTPGWANLAIFWNPGPPQRAIPFEWKVAKYDPWGDHLTYDSVQRSRTSTFAASGRAFLNTPTWKIKMEKLVEFLDFSKRYVSWVLDFKNCSELNWTSYCSEILVVQTESSFTFEKLF